MLRLQVEQVARSLLSVAQQLREEVRAVVSPDGRLVSNPSAARARRDALAVKRLAARCTLRAGACPQALRQQTSR
eukprot:14531420-Alexandrium_andersonii.AAC.1